jgi:hypothetical protein
MATALDTAIENLNPAKAAMDQIVGTPTGTAAPLIEPTDPQATLGTQVDIGQGAEGVFDPYADLNAELEALKQANNNMAISLGLTPTSGTSDYRGVGSGGEQMYKDYLGYYNKNQWNEADLANPVAGQVEGGGVQGLFYTPTGGKGTFQYLSSSALANPTVYSNVKAMARDPVADKHWYDMLNAYTPPPAPAATTTTTTPVAATPAAPISNVASVSETAAAKKKKEEEVPGVTLF